MAAETNIKELQEHGIIAKNHKLTADDQTIVNKLSKSEVKALISVKQKLGVEMLKKTARDGVFPHPDSISF